MPDKITLYDLAPSPNNMKVRIAMNYKGIPFEKIPVPPQDRSEVIRVSGQPLTPVITHGDRVIFDSASILRYLEANFRNTPPLFSTDYATMKEIERWEMYGRTELVRPVHTTFQQCFAEKKDFSETSRASRLLNELTGRVEDQLAKGSWLLGEGMTAADVSTAPLIFYGMLPAAVAESNPIARFFAEHLKLGGGREKTREWVGKTMAYDK